MDRNRAFDGGDAEVLSLLGRRLAAERLRRNQTQAALAEEAGVSRATIKRLEAGRSTQMTNLVRVLRALDLLANLDALVPPPEVRPLDELERGGRVRRRASTRRASETGEPWKWGDES